MIFSVEQQNQRLKREDCHRTKHDSAFSRWRILIGSSDWEDHRLGKDGAERYRIANLPNATSSSSCPGIYELGVAHVRDGRDLRKLAPHQILVVYLGQADNVRTRLQHYGRAGSHLDHHTLNSLHTPTISNHKSNNHHQQRSRFFQDVFARGFSIVFRWAPMKNKKEAEEKEALLLQVFDYAWNKVGNGSCRRDEILLKLRLTLPPANPLDTLLINLKLLKEHTFDKKQVGVRVNAASKPQTQSSSGFNQLRDRIFKLLKCHPWLVFKPKETNSNICGVVQVDGSICVNRPDLGRKRCTEHKGKRITATAGTSVIQKDAASSQATKDISCGLILEDGSVCMASPPKGRKRCEAHKGRWITIPKGIDPHKSNIDKNHGS